MSRDISRSSLFILAKRNDKIVFQNVRFFAPAPQRGGKAIESLSPCGFCRRKNAVWGFGEGGVGIGSCQVIPSSIVMLLSVRDRQWNELPAFPPSLKLHDAILTDQWCGVLKSTAQYDTECSFQIIFMGRGSSKGIHFLRLFSLGYCLFKLPAGSFGVNHNCPAVSLIVAHQRNILQQAT